MKNKPLPPYGLGKDACLLIAEEFWRQWELCKDGKFPWASYDPDAPLDHLMIVLMEELGEAARALQQEDWENLRAELVQVAAVAMGMYLGMEEECRPGT